MKLDFKKFPGGLLPAVIQDYNTQKVLMLGYMNEHALTQTEQTGKVTFFDPGSNQYWTRTEDDAGEMLVRQVLADCNKDSILVRAEPEGPVCHTGADTCWSEKNHSDDFLFYLEEIIALRKKSGDMDSQVSRLFEAGDARIAQRLGEEAIELVSAAADVNKDLFLKEAADLLFHYLILLQSKNKTLGDVIRILKERHQHR